MADKDSLDTRIPPDCPAFISQILYHAWHHDIAGLKPLLTVPGRASVQEPTTGETPLHAAIRACGPASQQSDAVLVDAAKAVIEELFFNGAIWNDIDSNNETPGCVAARLAQMDLYQLCVEAGVRAELLFGILEGYEQLSSEEEEEEEEEGDDGMEETVFQPSNGAQTVEDGEEAPTLVEVDTEIVDANPERQFVPPQSTTAEADDAGKFGSEAYLRSNLTYSDRKLVDESSNGVMMAWETSIMRKSVDALLPDLPAGKTILNVGFGMGIIDQMFSETQPSKHHIIEAHPDVLKHIREPHSKFGAAWEESAPSKGAYKVYEGRWQDVVLKLLEAGETYDAVYFDTFGEDYGQLREFFTEYVPGLLEEHGKFGFFNGLGADRLISYDVYTRVVEMHLSDAGMDIEWQELPVDMGALGEEGKGEWEGVKKRYWTLDKYRLPTCSFMG